MIPRKCESSLARAQRDWQIFPGWPGEWLVTLAVENRNGEWAQAARPFVAKVLQFAQNMRSRHPSEPAFGWAAVRHALDLAVIEALLRNPELAAR